jgi:hypothetical protein
MKTFFLATLLAATAFSVAQPAAAIGPIQQRLPCPAAPICAPPPRPTYEPLRYQYSTPAKTRGMQGIDYHERMNTHAK